MDKQTLELLGVILLFAIGVAGIILGMGAAFYEISPTIGAFGGFVVMLNGGSEEAARQIALARPPTPAINQYYFLVIGLVSVWITTIWIHTGGITDDRNH